MSDIRRVGEAGIHTVEGNIAGSRAAMLVKEREKQQAEYETLKKTIKAANATDVSRMSDKFNAAVDSSEQEFQKKTVGLVTAEEFRKAREAQARAEEERRVGVLKSVEEQEKTRQLEDKIKAEDREIKRRKLVATLSFANDDEEEEDARERLPLKKKIMKDPTVDTSFLPDAERERELALKREQLRKEWLEQQEKIKEEVSLSLSLSLSLPLSLLMRIVTLVQFLPI
jgi:protein FAM50